MGGALLGDDGAFRRAAPLSRSSRVSGTPSSASSLARPRRSPHARGRVPLRHAGPTASMARLGQGGEGKDRCHAQRRRCAEGRMKTRTGKRKTSGRIKTHTKRTLSGPAELRGKAGRFIALGTPDAPPDLRTKAETSLLTANNNSAGSNSWWSCFATAVPGSPRSTRQTKSHEETHLL